MFDSWAGFSLICPDLKDDQDFLLEGNQALMISQNFEFRIAKCDDARRTERGESPCNPDRDAIEKYVRDIQIDAWAVYEKINFQIRDGKPTFRVMDLQGTYIYDEKVAPQINFYLTKQNIETKDS